MPEVTEIERQPALPDTESDKPEIEALPADGERVIFAEEGNTAGWLSFEPEGVPEFPQR